MESIIHLELKSKSNDNHLYFGSIKAIYSKVPKSEIGVSYDTLVRRGFKLDPKKFENSKCIIRIGEVVRMPKNQEVKERII